MTEKLNLLAPLSGIVLSLSAVPDPVFADGMMGPGIAIEPLSSTLLAPCDGEISQLSATGHALSLRTANGAELLIHIGVDTMRLRGEGFTPRVKKGQQVRTGEPLVSIDIDAVARRAPSLITMLILNNPDGMTLDAIASGKVEAGTSPLLTVAGRPGELAPCAAEATRQAEALVAHAGGLHARPGALLQEAARRFDASIEIEFGGRRANARSVVAMMELGVGEGDRVHVRASGPDAARALDALVGLLQTHSAADHDAPAKPGVAQAVPEDGRLAGVCAAPGLAIGPVVQLAAQEPRLAEAGQGVAAERQALDAALCRVRTEIGADMRQAVSRGMQAGSGIFAAHLAMLDDPELASAASQLIGNGHSAAFAYRSAIRLHIGRLQALDNPLLAGRAADLLDLEYRVLDALSGGEREMPQLPEQAILSADDLTPSQLTRLPRERLAGLVLARGGVTGHVAILARALGIPALVAAGAAALRLKNGTEVVLDASAGWLDPQPDATALAAARRRIAESEARRSALRAHAAGPATTRDGLRIEVAANVANAEDTRVAVLNGADGVGLLRTEFLFSGRTESPGTESQRVACQAVLDALGKRCAIIRTLDAGGDKELPYLSLPAEENPELGLRGIRTSLAIPGLLDSQLNALLQLKPLSRLRVMLPMVSDLAELLAVRERIELLARHLHISERPQLGVMVEVPSAALLAGHLAAHADFMSIGTNDLTQYTLAADRSHPALAKYQDALHPAVLRLIALTVEGARSHGRWVGVCGALASDPQATAVLVGLGITELSVSPALVPEIKERARGLDAAACRGLAEELLRLESAAQVRARVAAWEKT